MINRLACAVIATWGFASPSAAVKQQLDWVVLQPDAKLYMHPELGSGLTRSGHGGGELRFRKVGELPDGWVEIETACDSFNSCYDGWGIQLRLFVRSDAFVPVLLKRMRLRLSDGSWHVFPSGTPVERGAAPGKQVVRENGETSAALPANAVGRVYKAERYSDSHSAAALPAMFGRNSAVGNHLPAKTLLFWRDGSAAGQLVNDHLLDCEIDKRPCFHQRIGEFEAVLCGGANALDPVGAAMQEAFQKPQGEPP